MLKVTKNALIENLLKTPWKKPSKQKYTKHKVENRTLRNTTSTKIKKGEGGMISGAPKGWLDSSSYAAAVEIIQTRRQSNFAFHIVLVCQIISVRTLIHLFWILLNVLPENCTQTFVIEGPFLYYIKKRSNQFHLNVWRIFTFIKYFIFLE